ncbi:Zinc finger BED domain-containing protein 4 [Frankliniella fusca]|uniref:Zinc finger BED domain-containing protein 4 n=1 Tax=Frankliniella fusca TaxID=407009 RepID=A0AAE1HNI5_9NEOP|nr:Zinc finger BED domain-containing protein 4 [Frankliniella fusca]
MAPPKSDIWKYWNKHGDKKEKKAQCKTCFKIYASSNGTTNLWKHSASHGILRPGKATADGTNYDTNEEETDNPQHYGNLFLFSFAEGGSRSARLEDALLFMVVKDNLALSTPEKEGFRYFAKEAVPLWTPISRKTLTSRMEDKYESLHRVVSDAMAEVETISLTADCWTDMHSNNSFLGLTAHFPVEDKMESAVLGTIHLEESHTGPYLSSKLTEFCDSWKIDNSRVSMIITDNAENIKMAARLAFGQDRCLTCFDHTLNLIPSAAIGYKGGKKANGPNIPCVMELIQKVKHIVTFSHTSNLFSDALKRVQREQGRTEGTFLRLTQEVPTRWNSGYLMIDKFIEMFGIIALVSMEFPDLNMVTNLELQSLRVVRDLLRPFHLVTAEMSAEKVTTASKVIPLLHILTNKVSDMVVPPTETVGNALKTFLLSELHRRFKDVEHNMPLAIATLLDPRFMKMYFKQPIALARTMSKVEDFVKAEIRREATEAEVEAQTAAATQTLEAAPAGCHGQGLWGDHDTFIATRHTAATSDDPAGKARIQLRSFLDRAPAPRSSNPLTVWEGIKQVYPQLYKLARRYLSILATSVPCERQFSHCGAIMDDQGSRLTPTHLSHRVFLGAVDTNLWRKNSYSKS